MTYTFLYIYIQYLLAYQTTSYNHLSHPFTCICTTIQSMYCKHTYAIRIYLTHTCIHLFTCLIMPTYILHKHITCHYTSSSWITYISFTITLHYIHTCTLNINSSFHITYYVFFLISHACTQLITITFYIYTKHITHHIIKTMLALSRKHWTSLFI